MTDSENSYTHHEKKSPSTLKDVFKFQINLPNKGSVARDHSSQLANERTFLSWTRTSLAFVTFGIGFMQFYRLEEKSQCPEISQPLPHPSSAASSASTSLFNHNISDTVIALCRPIGGMCIILGILTILFGMYRFFTVQRALMKQEFPVTRLTVVVLLLVNLSILLLLLVLNFKVSL
ncbi:hypothetical protein KGF57_004700 [Candida theae]|uniref:DUF202 domain-containing protein n=1 Tax=Candida theae TaxID=1198502 RepID=A0AAD5BBN7_9ASCO|nr:uncharacterized protein KGF57_004700 [Candida theae]KAI5949490.1 hypothetical protein KGF57_004700 [Candida theae]